MNNQFFYHIYPLGFCGAKEINSFRGEPVNRLEKIYGWLDHLSALGVTSLYIGPLFESGTHGYDTADWYHVDRRLGSDRDFGDLCREIKSRGMKVILDGVFNHCGRGFRAFKDLQEKKEASPFREWFSGLNFGFSSPAGDPFSYDCWEGHYDLVKLNLNNSSLREHLFGAVASWIRDYDIDGLRLDVAYCLPPFFLKELARFTRNLKPGFFLLGEAIHGDYRQLLNDGELDSVTNYECFKGIYSAHNDRNLFEIAHSLERQFGRNGIYTDALLYNFLDNHDVNRIASLIDNPAHVYTAYLLLFTMPGIPALYYGSEWGVQGRRSQHSDRELRPAAENIMAAGLDRSLERTVKQLALIRRNSNPLRLGDFQMAVTANEQMAFTRVYENETVLVVLNIANRAVDLVVPTSRQGVFVDLLNKGEEFPVSQGNVELSLYPHWGRILKLIP